MARRRVRFGDAPTVPAAPVAKAPAAKPAPAPAVRKGGIPMPVILGGIAALVAFLVLQRKNVATIGKMVFDAAKKLAFKGLLDKAAQPYAEAILTAADRVQVSPFLVVSLMWRETLYGTKSDPKGPAGYGDKTPRAYAKSPPAGLPVRVVGKNEKGQTLYMPPEPHKGWGFGLMQIDWATNYQWLQKNNWQDPATNLAKAMEILKGKMRFFQLKSTGPGDPRPLSGDKLIEASIAAYNTGEGRVLESLKANKPVDATTADGNYSNAVLAMGARLQQAFERLT